MAQLLNLPIRFRFKKIPVTWERRNVGTGIRISGTPKDIELDSVLSELDGKQCLDEFLNLPSNDVEALRQFLEKVGMWDFGSGASFLPYWPVKALEIDPEQIWVFREGLKDGLLAKYRKNFLAQVAPVRAPKTVLDIARPVHADFPLRFELDKVATGAVTITNAYHAILASVFVYIVQDIPFGVCEREDCTTRVFPIESGHERKYCSQECGHLESVRRQRREAKQRKMKAKLEKRSKKRG